MGLTDVADAQQTAVCRKQPCQGARLRVAHSRADPDMDAEQQFEQDRVVARMLPVIASAPEAPKASMNAASICPPITNFRFNQSNRWCLIETRPGQPWLARTR